MRVQFSYPTLVRDGAEGITINIQSLGRALTSHGVDVELKCPSVELRDLNKKWTHVMKGAACVPLLWDGLARSEVDVVHFHIAMPSQSVLARVARLMAPGAGRPLIGHLWNAFAEEGDLQACHSGAEALSHRLLNGPVLARAGVNAFDATIVASEYQRRQLREVGYRGAVHLIPNGVDLRRFCPATPEERAAERQSLGLPKESLLISYYGHLTPWKGVLHLVRAFAAVAARVPSAILVIARTGYGSEEPLLRAELDRLGVASRAVFLGKLDPAVLLRASDVAVVPAVAAVGTAVFPNVLLESMAAGLPVVATQVGTVAEVVRDGVNGVLVPPADSDALACALIRLLEDDLLRRYLGQQARRTATERFDWETIASRVAHVYDTELERAAAQAGARGPWALPLAGLRRAQNVPTSTSES